jgi:hypothetical protein
MRILASVSALVLLASTASAGSVFHLLSPTTLPSCPVPLRIHVQAGNHPVPAYDDAEPPAVQEWETRCTCEVVATVPGTSHGLVEGVLAIRRNGEFLVHTAIYPEWNGEVVTYQFEVGKDVLPDATFSLGLVDGGFASATYWSFRLSDFAGASN